MKKSILTLMIVLISGILFVGVGVVAAGAPPVFPIENDGYKKDKKGPVSLSHKKHAKEYGLACADCHHVYEDGKNVYKEGDPVQKCSECHDFKKKQGKAMKLQNAYHRNCKDCHKAANKEGKKAPFKKCNDCHAKKAK